MCQLPGQEKWTLFGITSWGRYIAFDPFCTVVRYPSAFTRVVNFIPWIQNILDQED